MTPSPALSNSDANLINVERGTLVVLSGLPGSGKSSILARSSGLPDGAVMSTDALRRQILVNMPAIDDGRRLVRVRNECNETVFPVMRAMVKERLVHGLTTVVDATNINDSERKDWVDLATATGRKHLVVIVNTPLEECIRRMSYRSDWVAEWRIREMAHPAAPQPTPEQVAKAAKKGKTIELTAPLGFTPTSQFNHVVVSSEARLSASPRRLSSEKTDVVGDVHGLLTDFLKLVGRAGWTLYPEGRLRHADPERRLLLLGDLVDRGPHSLELLEIVRRAQADGLAECIQGNHELKLVNFVDTAEREGIPRWGSRSNAETGMKLMRMSKDKRDVLVDYMRNMPDCVVHEGVGVPPMAFVHGNVYDFNPDLSLKGDLVYGQTGILRKGVSIDSDAIYEAGVAAGLNTHLLFRGHAPATNPDPSATSHIFSLEKHAFQKGELMLLRLDQFAQALRAGTPSHEAFESSLIRQRCDFDFEAYGDEQYALARGMESLVSRKLARRYDDDTGLLRGYKYSKEVFFEGSWGASEWLLKARGIVLDAGGVLVSHPFDKVFNAGEQGAGNHLRDSDPVVRVDKLNGFLGVVSPHPIRRGELLVHTQGSLDPKSEFVGYIRDLMDPKMAGRTAAFLGKNPMTLMFEVLHPKDPHIIPYGDDMMGLHLIGARGLGFKDKEVTEERLDEIAAEVGLRRPAWQRCTWGDVKEAMGTCAHEGFMVREDTPGQDFILKSKSPYYLTVKFLGRLSDSKSRFMFANPEQFKRDLDEELYPVVDAVTARFVRDDFMAMAHEDRVPMVREMLSEIDFTQVAVIGRSRSPKA